jgi:hypothetical protein
MNTHEERETIRQYNKTADVLNKKCVQCGEVVGPQWFINEVCGKCCRKNHKEAMGK